LAVILFFILVSSAASAASSLKITETRITTNPSNSEHPAFYGNTIVWQDDRNGNWDIYIFDISTKEQIGRPFVCGWCFHDMHPTTASAFIYSSHPDYIKHSKMVVEVRLGSLISVMLE
jgi:beta propeller repeat protein